MVNRVYAKLVFAFGVSRKAILCMKKRFSTRPKSFFGTPFYKSVLWHAFLVLISLQRPAMVLLFFDPEGLSLCRPEGLVGERVGRQEGLSLWVSADEEKELDDKKDSVSRSFGLSIWRGIFKSLVAFTIDLITTNSSFTQQHECIWQISYAP